MDIESFPVSEWQTATECRRGHARHGEFFEEKVTGRPLENGLTALRLFREPQHRSYEKRHGGIPPLAFQRIDLATRQP